LLKERSFKKAQGFVLYFVQLWPAEWSLNSAMMHLYLF